MSIRASDLARRLAEHAEAVCRHYLSNGRRTGRYWIVGDVRNTPGRSMYVRLKGPASGKGAAGKWTDAATSEHGDLLDIIRESCGLVEFNDVAKEARRFLSLPQSQPSYGHRTRKQPPAPTGSPESARRLFAMSQPIAGTIAEKYLRRRGITSLPEPAALRFHRRCYYRPDVDEPTEVWPALIAAVTDLAGNVTGVHRTWLSPDGNDKAPVDTPRRSMGYLLGHGVRAIVGGIANFHKLPFTLFVVNNALTGAVADAAVHHEVERFVYVSSSMVFERATEFPTTEEHLGDCPAPRSPYGFSKLAGEVYTRAANEQHGLRYTICRPFNAYGPGELPEPDEPGIAHAVPDLIHKALTGQRPMPIFGSGGQTRTITHVDDIADGIITAMASPAGENEDFNISASEELTVAELARVIWDACGNDAAQFELEHLPSFPVDVQRRWPSVEKARRLLGWEAQVDLRDGIAQTVEWLRDDEAVSSKS